MLSDYRFPTKEAANRSCEARLVSLESHEYFGDCHRQLLRAALRSEGLLSRLREMPDVGSDDDFERASDLPRDIDL